MLSLAVILLFVEKCKTGFLLLLHRVKMLHVSELSPLFTGSTIERGTLYTQCFLSFSPTQILQKSLPDAGRSVLCFRVHRVAKSEANSHSG